MSSAHRVSPLPPQTPPPEPARVRLAAAIASLVWWALLTVLLLFALYVGIGRQLTRNIDNYSADLAQELSTRSGHTVTIGGLSSRWYWLDPSFTATDVVVSAGDSGETLAKLEHLQIRLNFLSSLLHLRIVLKTFEADGLELILDQSRLQPAQMPETEAAAGDDLSLKHWLDLAGQWMSDPYVKITRLNLSILDKQGYLRQLEVPQLDLIYRYGQFHASGRAMQPGTTEQLASFSLVGQHFFRGDFTGGLYLDVNSGRLFDGLLDDYQWHGIRVEGFDLGGEAWLSFRDGQLEQANGSLKTPYLQLGVGEKSLSPLKDIQARFGWRRSGAQGPGEWHLKQLGWNWNGTTVSPFSVRLMPVDGGTTVISDALPLGPLAGLVSSLPILPERASSALEHYRPAGFLDNMTLWLPDDAGAGFELSGALREVSVQAYHGAPGGSGLYGSLKVNEKGGTVRVHAGDEPATLGFPELFRGDWSFPELEAEVSWQLDGAITRVFSDSIHMRHGDKTRLSGAFDLRLDRNGEDNLGLRVGVENGTADMLADFVPNKVVPSALYNWLTTAIHSADITSGVYYGHGQIGSGAPRHSFTSSMRYDFTRARVTYDEHWPEVTGASGRVVVNDGHTLVTLEQGQTGGLTLSPSTVTVVPGDGNTRVLVATAADVPGAAVARWLDSSPLGEMAGKEVSSLEFAGQYHLKLDIDLPLANTREVQVVARVGTGSGTVSYPPAGLTWTDVSGSLNYHSRDGFSGDPLKARFFDQPVQVRLSQGASGKSLVLTQDGQLQVPGIFEAIGLTSDSSYGLKGSAAYRAQLEVGAGKTSGVRVRSDLAGLEVDWPGGLGKGAGEATGFEAVIDPLAADGVKVSGNWEDRMAFDLLWKDSGFDLDFGWLRLGGNILKNIQINALDQGDRWIVNTRSERAIGRIEIPENRGKVLADFDLVRLVSGDEEAREQAPELLTLDEELAAFRSLDMGNWPDLDVTIADLQLNQKTLGTWSFGLRPEPYRLTLEDIRGTLNSLVLQGDLDWSMVKERGISRFTGSITGGALKDLNDLLGTDVPLTNKSSDLQLNLQWPGRPDELALKKLSGEVSLRLDEGVILQQSNSAQLFRVFNLLNADTLWRRLKLDFSDLYERGVAFDAISGKANIVNGVVRLDPELQVVGPSGAFKLSGSTDMANEQLDMNLVVVLPLTQNLPLAALLMGAGAPVGGALFVLDKILGDPLSKLTSASYRVTGSWSDPKVDLRRVFDNGE